MPSDEIKELRDKLENEKRRRKEIEAELETLKRETASRIRGLEEQLRNQRSMHFGGDGD